VYCVTLGIPRSQVHLLPSAQQTEDTRQIEAYESAIKTPHPNGGYRPDCCPPPTPTPTPLTAAANVRPCTAGDLRAEWYSSEGISGGQMSASIALGNASSDPCRLSLPEVELLDASSSVLITLPAGGACSAAAAPGPCIFADPLLMLPGLGALPAPHAPLLTGQAALAIYWQIDDGAGFCPTPPAPAPVVRLVVPLGVGLIDVPVGDALPRITGVRALAHDNNIAPCNGIAKIDAFSGAP
jgi:hypothetical protein